MINDLNRGHHLSNRKVCRIGMSFMLIIKKKQQKNSRTFTTPLDKTRRAAYQLVAINETKRVLIYGFWLQVV